MTDSKQPYSNPLDELAKVIPGTVTIPLDGVERETVATRPVDRAIPTRMDLITKVMMPQECDLHKLWEKTIFASRPTTPILPDEALYLMALGFWAAHRNVYERIPHSLSTYFYNIVRRIDEQYERELEAIEAAEQALPPEHTRDTHQDILTRIKRMNPNA